MTAKKKLRNKIMSEPQWDYDKLLWEYEQLQAENKRLRDAINQALPSISSAMGDYNDARYIDIDVLYCALKDK